MIHIKLAIAGNKQIEAAVMIVVSPTGASRPVTQRHTGFHRHVGERAVVIIVVEAVLSVICKTNFPPALPVVIPPRHAQTPAPLLLPRPFLPHREKVRPGSCV